MKGLVKYFGDQENSVLEQKRSTYSNEWAGFRTRKEHHSRRLQIVESPRQNRVTNSPQVEIEKIAAALEEIARVFSLRQQDSSVDEDQSCAIETFIFENLAELSQNLDEPSEGDSLSAFLMNTTSRFGKSGLNKLQRMISKEEISQPRLAEQLIQIIGSVHQPWSKDQRKDFLLSLLSSKNPRTRYSAVLGLSNYENEAVLPHFQSALKTEDNPLIRNVLADLCDGS